ncbi:hypothetical protein [Agrobacterium tumefaciens]|uniref:Uncharacterized protein n=1 Tax=Agrobacterium tumefaciens TaxID=358 RepID=A0A4D7YXG9_AGRTU|nr:hypothetical protein [Agrobacterium tumefaciens]QCL95754.1 hypothetical protein CFBP7129_15825 [Agrobacterium tumefaciens]
MSNNQGSQQSDAGENNKTGNAQTEWLPVIHATLGTCTLIGAGIGGMLHFLNVGEGHPEYQMFVLRTSAFILILIFFLLIMATLLVVTVEAGKLERQHSERKYLKFVIRCLTAVFAFLLFISAYGIFVTGGEFFIKGLKEYFDILKAAR